jgi:hypothetical protein
MQSLAEVYENEAKRTAQFLRSGRTDLPLLFLIWYVRGTSKSGDNWGELARLLTDAFEAAGKSGDFSPEKLRMLWKRQGDVADVFQSTL